MIQGSGIKKKKKPLDVLIRQGILIVIGSFYHESDSKWKYPERSILKIELHYYS